MKDMTRKAEAMLAACETPEETRDMVEGLLNTLQSVSEDCKVVMDYMEELEDEGQEASPAWVHDRLEEMRFEIEENTQT